MAFILPLAILGGSGVGFVAGYIYNSDSSTQQPTKILDINNITERDLMKLKGNSPHKEIHHELITFDKQKLKKTSSKVNITKLTEEQEMIENLRQKILSRRNMLDVEHTDMPIMS
jgi:hypothetical protein